MLNKDVENLQKKYSDQTIDYIITEFSLEYLHTHSHPHTHSSIGLTADSTLTKISQEP